MGRESFLGYPECPFRHNSASLSLCHKLSGLFLSRRVFKYQCSKKCVCSHFSDKFSHKNRFCLIYFNRKYNFYLNIFFVFIYRNIEVISSLKVSRGISLHFSVLDGEVFFNPDGNLKTQAIETDRFHQLWKINTFKDSVIVPNTYIHTYTHTEREGL